jgi:xanthine dehydrogenase accessory factor
VLRRPGEGGGRAKVFFEPALRPRTVHLFGAGHVGRATADVLAGTPLAVVAVDARPEWARDLPAGVAVRREEPLAYAQARDWGPEDGVCIFTHSHELDYALVRFFLDRSVGYLGLIGSEHKAAVFQARLKAEGERFQELWDEKMHCPIGRPLGSKNPKVIAVAVASELLEDWALKPERARAEPT